MTTQAVHRNETGTTSLRGKLRWTIYARLTVFAFLGSATAVFGADSFHSFAPLSATDVVLFVTAGIGCVLSLFYAFALKFVRTYRYLQVLAYVQLAGDMLSAAVLVLLTGGTQSSFTFFFSLVIIEGAILTFRPGAFISATGCMLLLVLIGVLEMGGVGEQTLLEAVNIELAGKNAESQYAAWGGLAYRLLNNFFAFYSIAFVGSILTERARESAQQLELSRHSLANLRAIHESIIDSIPSGLITLDEKGDMTFFNQKAETITGVAYQNVLGQPFLSVFPDAQPLFEESTDESPLRTTAQRAGGYMVDLEWSIAPLKNTRKPGGHLIVLQDVTALTHLAREMKRSERYATIGKLSASIAHEIRNPLASIAGSIQLLSQTGDLSEDDERLMQIVRRETEALNHWITDFLTYAKPVSTDRVAVRVEGIVQEVILALKSDERSEGVETEVVIRRDSRVLSDPASIRQVLWNLLLNACEAMPDGGKLWVELDEQSEGMCQLRITDTGGGIPPDNADRVFDPFFTTKASGTGLGLATAYRMVSELGGSLKFHSLHGEGTTFYVELPTEAKALSDAEEKLEQPEEISKSDTDALPAEVTEESITELSNNSVTSQEGRSV